MSPFGEAEAGDFGEQQRDDMRNEDRCEMCSEPMPACVCCHECGGHGNFDPAGSCGGGCDFCPPSRVCGACKGTGQVRR